jgi:hypothetical protein
MRIAFDIDDTLIPCGRDSFAAGWPRGFIGKLFAREPLRDGAVPLMQTLTKEGWDLWVYTTSFRTPFYLRTLFRCYGLPIRGVVNQEIHWRWLRRQDGKYHCSKYPPAFGIDLLVDDSEGVQQESVRFRFQMVLVRPGDSDWADKVLAAARGMAAR